MPRDGTKNLKPFNQMTEEEQKKIAKKGGIASGIASRKRKEERKKRKTIVDPLKDVLYSDVTNRKLLQMLDQNGISGEKNYLVAMISSAILKGVQKGNLADILKLIEVLEGSATEKIEITNMDQTVLDLQSYLADKRKGKENNNGVKR